MTAWMLRRTIRHVLLLMKRMKNSGKETKSTKEDGRSAQNVNVKEQSAENGAVVPVSAFIFHLQSLDSPRVSAVYYN